MNPSDHNPLDLDGLKSLWNVEMQTEAESFSDNQQILTIMQQKTTTTVARFQRNLLLECLTAVPLFIGAYFLFDFFNKQLPLLVWLGIVIIAFGYHIYLYITLKKQAEASAPLAVFLETQLAEIRKFMKMYEIIAVLFSIILFFATLFQAYVILILRLKLSILILVPQFCIAALASAGAFFVTHWFANKLYGQHYATLQACYAALK
jgi:hypothetical protein